MGKREGNIEIVKVDQNGASVEGAEFKVVDESGKQVAKQKQIKKENNNKRTTSRKIYSNRNKCTRRIYIKCTNKNSNSKTGETARIKAVNEK